MIQSILRVGSLILCVPLIACAPTVDRRPAGYVGLGSAEASIRFRDETSASFKLVKLEVELDGTTIYARSDDGQQGFERQIPLLDSKTSPGQHELGIDLQLRGHGVGVFSYLKGYVFKVKSRHEFELEPGKRAAVEAILYEQCDGGTTPLEERPRMRYEVSSGALPGS